MALSAFVIWDVRTTGSDTANGGAFDPSVTAGMNTDGAATSADTSAPVFTSASYNFVAGDVGAWLFIASGTDWTPGWYQIASVASNAATLSAAVGAGTLMYGSNAYTVTTAAGCATVASPTGATWSIDYSQQDAAQVSYTDLASAGAGLLVSSATSPFGKHQVGNMLVIASGTNFTAGNYIIASIGGSNVATVTGAGNITTGAGASGVGGLGGALATPGKAMQRYIAGNKIFIKAGTYTITSGTNNVAGGKLNMSGAGTTLNMETIVGWSSARTVDNTGTAPELNFGAVTGVAMITVNSSCNFILLRNLVIDGNSSSTSTGLTTTGVAQKYSDIWVKNTTSTAIALNGGNSTIGYNLRASGCSGTVFHINNSVAGVSLYNCEAYNNTASGFTYGNNAVLVNCIASNNTSGGTKYGFVGTGMLINCVAYGNDSSGYLPSATALSTYINCIAEGNGDFGWSASGALKPGVLLINCAGYNNTSGNFLETQIYPANTISFISQTAGSFFTNAASGDFSLNDTAGRGALLRGTGYPQLLPRGLTANSPDIGASQASSSGSGGGTAMRKQLRMVA